MTNLVVQVRMPSVIIKNIEDLVKKGVYKNKSEVIIDAVRRFVGIRQTEIDALWEKIRRGKQWKKRFGTSAESVMEELRGRGSLAKLKPDGAENYQHE